MFEHLPAPRDDLRPTTFSDVEPGGSESYAQTAARWVYKAGYGAVYDFASKPEVYSDILSSAERSTRLTGHAFSELSAREEAYDARIAAAKMFAGVDMENPERGGYAPEARKAIRETIRANGWEPIEDTGGVRAIQQRIFDEKWKALQAEHIDNPEIQKFVDIDQEGKAAARIAADENARLLGRDDVNPVAGFLASIPGSIWGMRRDPIFTASLFAGPTSAIGKSALARIGTSAMFQGAYNAGLSAVEQPVVQDWRSQIGLQSGIVPALEEVGMAFLFGAIIGAPLRAVHEAFTPHAPAVQRVMAGNPEPGDVAAAVKAVGGELTPEQAAAVRVGEDAIRADEVAFADPPQLFQETKQLHDDLARAALRHAEDPAEPPPQVLMAERAINEPGDAPVSPQLAEIRQRVEQARPETQEDARRIASEVMEEQGNRATVARLESDLAQKPLPAPIEAQGEAVRPKASKEPIDQIPWLRDDGSATTVTRETLAREGQREAALAELVRACK